MQIMFLGAAHEVTGSCTLLNAAGYHILVDCGMEQGIDIYENCEMPISPSEIDCVFLTHAHIDHSGKLPWLFANGLNCPIYATEATTRLCRIMLQDSAHIQEFEAQWRNRKNRRSGKELYVPMYTTQDALGVMELFKPSLYEIVHRVLPGVTATFVDAGHLLGSSSVSLTVEEDGQTETIVFSGDIGNTDQPIIRDPRYVEKADYVVMESTYGDRSHGPRIDYIEQLTPIIQRTLDRGGNVVIPSFAVGRTQELLYFIREIKERRLIKNHDHFPVYVDSPLAVESTQVFSIMSDCFDDEAGALVRAGINPINFEDLCISVTSDDSIAINNDPVPKVIISASGMCDAGRIRHHLKHNLWRKESTVLFVGYQSAGTLGRALADGVKHVRLFDEQISVNAEICILSGISGHADCEGLMKWIGEFKEKPKKVFVNHGEDMVTERFAKRITHDLGIAAVAPFNGAVYDLITGECLEEGNKVRLEKPTAFTGRHKHEDTVFGQLQDAGQILLQVINRNKGGANKDLRAFTKELQALCKKWDR